MRDEGQRQAGNSQGGSFPVDDRYGFGEFDEASMGREVVT
jgi:hypothetical protein